MRKTSRSLGTTVAAKEKDLLVRRVAANLEVEARAGRAQRPVNRLASRVWLALSEGVVPYEAIPYVRALAADSVQSIATNLRRGFNSQAEADEAEGDGPF